MFLHSVGEKCLKQQATNRGTVSDSLFKGSLVSACCHAVQKKSTEATQWAQNSADAAV